MKKTIKRLIHILCLAILTLIVLSPIAFAAQYVYYGGGLVSPRVEVENRLRYGIFSYCIGRWNNTGRVVITQVPGSGHSYCIDGQWDDTWYGMYTPLERQFIFWGRATRFKIELNRNQLVSKSDSFKKSVLVHELGHAFCLGDNPSTGNASIMNYTRNREYLTWPTSNDVIGVYNAYN